MSSPLVSILTPALNPGPDLLVPARSIAAQTLMAREGPEAAEWIIVDDGSRESEAVHFEAAREAAGVPTTIVRLERPGGQGAARNLAVTHAKGRFVKFCDADDGLSETHLEGLVDVADAWLSEFVLPFAPTRHVFLNGGRTLVNRRYKVVGDSSEEQLVRFLESPFLHHGGVLFPRELAGALGPYDAALCTDEDGDLLIRTLLAGYRFRAVEGVSYDYRHHGQAGRVSYDGELDKVTARRTVSRRVAEHYHRRNIQMPAAVRSALATRLDLLAARSVLIHPAFAHDVLREARALAPGYRPSGSQPERLLRVAIGLRGSQRVMGLVRKARGIRIS